MALWSRPVVFGRSCGVLKRLQWRLLLNLWLPQDAFLAAFHASEHVFGASVQDRDLLALPRLPPLSLIVLLHGVVDHCVVDYVHVDKVLLAANGGQRNGLIQVLFVEQPERALCINSAIVRGQHIVNCFSFCFALFR